MGKRLVSGIYKKKNLTNQKGNSHHLGDSWWRQTENRQEEVSPVRGGDRGEDGRLLQRPALPVRPQKRRRNQEGCCMSPHGGEEKTYPVRPEAWRSPSSPSSTVSSGAGPIIPILPGWRSQAHPWRSLVPGKSDTVALFALRLLGRIRAYNLVSGEGAQRSSPDHWGLLRAELWAGLKGEADMADREDFYSGNNGEWHIQSHSHKDCEGRR